jgi:hypothetical protein
VAALFQFQLVTFRELFVSFEPSVSAVQRILEVVAGRTSNIWAEPQQAFISETKNGHFHGCFFQKGGSLIGDPQGVILTIKAFVTSFKRPSSIHADRFGCS